MFLLGRANGQPVFANSESHLLVLGPPRSGKTTSLVLPNVSLHHGPVIATSTKPDLLTQALDARRAKGEVWLFDPSGSVEMPAGVRSLRWSPLEASYNLDGAVLMVDAMVDAAIGSGRTSDSHWNERAKALLAPLLLAASAVNLDIADVVSWVDTRDVTEPLAILRTRGEQRALEVLLGISAAEDRERSGILSTASGALSAYRSEAALEMGSRINFSPTAFVSSLDTVFVVSPTGSQKVLAPLIVAFVERVRAATYERQFSSPSEGAHPQVAIFLDEMANIAPLPNLPSILSEGASQGVSVMGALQDLTQAERRWPVAYRGFLTLFGTTVVLPGISDPATLRDLSYLGGKERHLDVTVSESRSGRVGLGRRRSTSFRFTERAKVEALSIMRPGAGGAMVYDGRVGFGSIELVPMHGIPDRGRGATPPETDLWSPGR